jgi:AmpD protein
VKVDIDSGLLDAARYIASPNCDARPDPGDIDLLVIHGISLPPGEFGGPWIDALFTNALDADAHPYFREIAGLQVSSHLLIRRRGTVTQYVPFHRRAWHAGESRFGERPRCNDFSIGIELEGADDQAYTDEQYRALFEVIDALRDAYPAPQDRSRPGIRLAPAAACVKRRPGLASSQLNRETRRIMVVVHAR